MSNYKPEVGEAVKYRKRSSTDDWQRCQLRARSGLQVWLQPHLNTPDDPHTYHYGQHIVVDEPDYEFQPIPKRGPSPGEVWVLKHGAVTICVSDEYSEEGLSFVQLDGSNTFSSAHGATFAASSIKEHIAREFLAEYDRENTADMWSIVEEAAQLDGEG